MKILFTLVLCVLTPLSAAAQSLSLFGIDTTNFPTMKAKFYAFDGAGNPVKPNIGDVSITEDGTPRTVTSITCPPSVKSTLSVCIMVDTKYFVGLARAGTERLVNLLDMPQDELGITVMQSGVQIHHDFTGDRAKALAAAGTIPSAPGVNVQAMFYAPITGGVPFISGQKADKKVLILISDLHCPKLNLNEPQFYADAAKENITVYSILLNANDYTGLFKRVADNTKGKVFEKVTTESEITNIFKEIEQREHWQNQPCDITWQSGSRCQTKNTNIELSWNGHKAFEQYIAPEKSDARLTFFPSQILCKNKVIGSHFDTTVTVTANNSSFTVLGIVSNNPIFDITPKTLTLNPGQSAVLTVSYTPVDSGYTWTKFDIQTDICPQLFFAMGGFSKKKPSKSTLRLTSPNGTEIFVAGADSIITWEGIPATDTVTLEFSIDNGTTWKFITNSATGLRYNWENIPKPSSNICLVRISQGRKNSDNSPNIEWQKCLGGSDGEYAHSIQQTADEGYIVAGSTKSKDGDVTGNHGIADFWVVRLDFNGTIEWQKCLGGSGNDEVASIQQTNDGGYIVAGSSESNDGDVSGNHGVTDIWVVKLDVDGVIEWQKCLGGSGNDGASSIQQTIDGGYIIAGWTESNDGDVSGNHGKTDFWVVKLDTNGNTEWKKCLGGSNLDYARSLQQTLDGGYIVAGMTNSNNNDVNGLHGNFDFWVVKLSATSILQWQQCLGGNNDDVAYSVQQTMDGDYIVAGNILSSGGNISRKHGGNDGWVAKFNASGSIQWQKCLGGVNYDYVNLVSETMDGGYILEGETHSFDGDVVGNHGFIDFWIIKLNASGVIQWQKCMGGSEEDKSYTASQTVDGGYIVAGQTLSNDYDVIGKHGSEDIWVVKLSPEGDGIFQEDISDAVFSIIAPEPILQVIDIDMGKTIVGDYNDNNEPAAICNRGAASLHVLGLDVTSGDTPDFMISRGAGEFFLAPNGGCQDITFTFTPTKVGKRSAKATLRTTVGNFTDTITIHGEGIAPLLQVETPMVNFGKVLIGATKDTLVTVTIRNVGTAALDIKDSHHDKPNDKDFITLTGGGSFTLAPGATRAMQLRFMPSDEGRTTGLLSFEYNGPGSPAQLQLIGEGFRPDSSGITLIVGTASAFPGEHTTIPITLELPQNSTLSTVTGFDVTLRYNPTLLFPADNSMTVTSSGNEALLTFFAPYNPAGGELLAVPFIATLGDDTTTIVKIEKVVPRVGVGKVDVATRDGSFALKGVCYAGGTARLYKPSGRAMLMAIHPNPAEDVAEIEFETSETGVTSLRVFNALGMEVAVPASGEMNTGFHIANVRTADFGAGTYFIVMTTPTEVHTARFEVVR